MVLKRHTGAQSNTPRLVVPYILSLLPRERTLLARAFYAEALQELQLRLNLCPESIKVQKTAPTGTKHKLNPAWLTRRNPSHWFLPPTITSSPMTG